MPCLLFACSNQVLLILPSAPQVFDAKDWDALVMRSIVPKLAWALQDVLVINPLQQDLAPFQWLTAWHTVLPQHHMVNLLEFRFFPAWHRVLQHWLSNNPDFDEVTRWYMGWKVCFTALSFSRQYTVYYQSCMLHVCLLTRIFLCFIEQLPQLALCYAL